MRNRIISMITALIMLVTCFAFPMVSVADVVKNEPVAVEETGDEIPEDPDQPGTEEPEEVTKKLESGMVRVNKDTFVYTGSEIKPTVTVVDGDNVLVEGTDYTVSYENNIKVGEAIIKVEGQGAYVGIVENSFNISKASIESAKVSFTYTNYSYKGGTKIYPKYTVSYKGKTLKSGKDFKVTYKNNQYPGAATMTITGLGNFNSSISKNYYIANVSNFKVKSTGTASNTLSWSKQSNITGYKVYKYDFSKKKWALKKTIKGKDVVTYQDKGLKPGTSCAYRIRTYVTKGGKTYYGKTTSTLYAPTRPAAVTLSSVTSSPDKAVTANWKKVSATGYQVMISKSSKFSSYKIHKVASSTAVSKKITGLELDKKYYVKVRAYKTYGSRTVYGKWSNVKSTTVNDSGWLTVGGKKYYYSNGKKAVGTKKISGNYYYFDNDGVFRGASPAMWDKVKNRKSGSKYLVCVSRNSTDRKDTEYRKMDGNRVCVYKRVGDEWVGYKYFLCTTGASATKTPRGVFSVPTIKDRKPSFGDGYTCWYATRIKGNVYFHSVLYNPGSKSSLQDGRLGKNLSHGCIRLALSNAKWIYDNIPKKTTVVIY